MGVSDGVVVGGQWRLGQDLSIAVPTNRSEPAARHPAMRTLERLVRRISWQRFLLRGTPTHVRPPPRHRCMGVSFILNAPPSAQTQKEVFNEDESKVPDIRCRTLS